MRLFVAIDITDHVAAVFCVQIIYLDSSHHTCEFNKFKTSACERGHDT
jgi:hypothetical protein